MSEAWHEHVDLPLGSRRHGRNESDQQLAKLSPLSEHEQPEVGCDLSAGAILGRRRTTRAPPDRFDCAQCAACPRPTPLFHLQPHGLHDIIRVPRSRSREAHQVSVRWPCGCPRLLSLSVRGCRQSVSTKATKGWTSCDGNAPRTCRFPTRLPPARARRAASVLPLRSDATVNVGVIGERKAGTRPSISLPHAPATCCDDARLGERAGIGLAAVDVCAEEATIERERLVEALHQFISCATEAASA